MTKPPRCRRIYRFFNHFVVFIGEVVVLPVDSASTSMRREQNRTERQEARPRIARGQIDPAM